MHRPQLDDFVRLRQDVPDLGLRRGEIGIIRGRWPGATEAYEVEFHHNGHNGPMRCPMNPHLMEVEDGPLLAPPSPEAPPPSAAAWPGR